jgi:hypothetical protein
MRAKEIYQGLIERWDRVCNDEAWIGSIKKCNDPLLSRGFQVRTGSLLMGVSIK